MALREIRLIGDEMLTKPCREVKEITPRIAELIEDMLETMYDADGIGLAAPQVGVLRRVVIIDIWQPGVEEAEEKQLGEDAAEDGEDAAETEAGEKEPQSDEADAEKGAEEQPSGEDAAEDGEEERPSGEDVAEDGEEEEEDEDEGPLIMINPVITRKEGEQTGDEGCLSLPGKVGTVTRPNEVTVTYFDENMEEYELEADGLLARAICHEVDHLEGHTYVEFIEGEIRDAGHSDSEEDEDGGENSESGESGEAGQSSAEGKSSETGESSAEEDTNATGEGS